MARFCLLLLICLLGGVTQGTCGFGCGIFATLGFSAYLPVPQAAAVTSIINLGLTLPMVLRYRKHLTLRRIVLPFLVYTVSAVLIIRFSAGLDGKLLKRFFGGFLVALSLYHFTLRGKQPARWTPWLAALAFIVSGLGSGLFGVGGPLLVLYFLRPAMLGIFLIAGEIMLLGTESVAFIGITSYKKAKDELGEEDTEYFSEEFLKRL